MINITAYFSLIRSFMDLAPLSGTHTKSRTVIRLRGCSVELQGLSKVGIQDTLLFLIGLMSWGGHLFLKGDRRHNLFCFTKLLTVWQKCPSYFMAGLSLVQAASQLLASF